MNEYQAYQNFWSAFGIPAYDESTVPDEAEMPYITYNVLVGEFEELLFPSISIWYKGTSWTAVSEKALEIESAIGYGGVTIPYDNGYIWIKRSTPSSQRLSDPDTLVRRMMLNLEVEYFRG
jgi:hypothetical protein